MIDLTEISTKPQVGFVAMVIAFAIFWRFFVKYEVPIKFSEGK